MKDTTLPWAMVTSALGTPAIGLEILEVWESIHEWVLEINWFLTSRKLSSENEK